MPEQLTPSSSQDSVSLYNPFPGLRPFEPHETDLYFGRERQVDDLLRRLRTTHFLSVVGASGSGKSSLVRAGLVPALPGRFLAGADTRWRVAIMRPGEDPIGHLAVALNKPRVLGGDEELGDTQRSILEATLRSSSTGLVDCVEQARLPEGDHVLVVVDQFEEIFRYQRGGRTVLDRDEAMAFVKLLLRAKDERSVIYVVLTMRSDFIGDCMQFPRLPEAINEAQYLVPRMNRQELRQAITGPVEFRRGEISPRLVSRLLNEVGDNPDQLPVLQHALMRVWGHWEVISSGEYTELGAVEPGSRPIEVPTRGGRLDVEHYEAVGTMASALDRHADKAYGELEDDRERQIAEHLFKALTDTDRDGRGIRRAAKVEQVCAIAAATEDEVIRVVDHFRYRGRSFLTPALSVSLTADSALDLSHESLMRHWKRLREWAEEEARSAKLYRRLASAAGLYDAGEGQLWRGPQLENALLWREEQQPTATWAERYEAGFERAMTFLEESRRARDTEVAREKREARTKRRWRISVAMAAALILALVAFVVYVNEKADRLAAISAALTEDDPLVKALVMAAVEPPLALLTGGDRRIALEAAFRAAWKEIPVADLHGQDYRLLAASFSPDGAWVVTAASDNTARIWPADGFGQPTALEGHVGAVNVASFSPDGRSAVTGSVDREALIWEVESGEVTRTLQGHEDEVSAAAWAPDGQRVLTVSRDGAARIWPLDESRPPIELQQPGIDLAGASSGPALGTFSTDGRYVLTARADGARLYDSGGIGDPVLLAHYPHERLTAAALSPDSEHVATAARHDPRALVWVRDGSRPPLELSHEFEVLALDFSPDGQRLVTGSADTTARIWGLERGDAEWAEETRRWNEQADCHERGEEEWVCARLERILGHEEAVTAVSFSPQDGMLVATASEDRTARIWRVDPPGGPLTLRGHRGAVTGVEFSPDGRYVVTVSDDGTARIWHSRQREPLVSGDPQDQPSQIAVSRDGSRALRVLPGRAEIFSWGSPMKIERLAAAPEVPATAAAISSDGRWVVAGFADGTAYLWSVDRPGEPIRFAVGSGPDLAKVAPNGIAAVVAEGRPYLLDPVSDPVTTPLEHDLVTDLAFDSRGRRLVTASLDGKARVWELDPTVTRVADFDLEDNPLTAVDFGPEGHRIAATFDSRAVIWRLEHGSAIPLDGHGAALTAVAFSPDGRHLATASVDQTVRVWSTAGDEKPRVLAGHHGTVEAVAFSPEGSLLASRSGDGRVGVWTLADTDRRLLFQPADGVREIGFLRPAPGMEADGEAVRLVVATEKWSQLELRRVTWPDLHVYLRESTSACLTAQQRSRFLGESLRVATSRQGSCEERRRQEAK